jgi:hypothetical protein
VSSERAWKKEIKVGLVSRFPKILNSSEKSPNFHLLHALDFPFLVKRFQALSGIKFGEQVVRRAKKSDLVLGLDDILEMQPRYVSFRNSAFVIPDFFKLRNFSIQFFSLSFQFPQSPQFV